MCQLVEDEVFSSGKSLVDDLHDLETVWTPYVSFGECFHIFFVGVELFVDWRDYCRFLLVAGCMGRRSADGRWWFYCQCRLCWWLCLSRTSVGLLAGLGWRVASPAQTSQQAYRGSRRGISACISLPSASRWSVGFVERQFYLH